MHCSNEGIVTIGSLSGRDGSNGLPLLASKEGCVMKGDAAHPDSSLFVPQLDKEQSKSVVDTATQQYKVSIVGSRLIPCGLFLEVFEHESESNADGKSVEFNLNDTSSETEVTFIIEQEEIAALDQKHELRCRLKFGQNLRTTDWFTFSAAHIDDPEPTKPKFSQTPLGKALSWILPVVGSVVLLLILLLIILLVWRRKIEECIEVTQNEPDCLSDEQENREEKEEEIENEVMERPHKRKRRKKRRKKKNNRSTNITSRTLPSAAPVHLLLHVVLSRPQTQPRSSQPRVLRRTGCDREKETTVAEGDVERDGPEHLFSG
ncbi:hypothetical protein BLNAU_15328 [Blattamonas nauphoetae]|uniref:Uncharacterized protein n=1 Tax=Blattamonas nauphoetae TaxID=2049346 RepID=A0ABQ9XEC5_9EUKA|nr:hypothetical protein BLNAU_15328 [Blattamonas nauphoetae]